MAGHQEPPRTQIILDDSTKTHDTKVNLGVDESNSNPRTVIGNESKRVDEKETENKMCTGHSLFTNVLPWSTV